LHLATALGHDRTAEVLVWGAVCINRKNCMRETPLLMLACRTPPKRADFTVESLSISMVKTLIGHGVDVHLTDKHGRNALQPAVRFQAIGSPIIKFLVGCGIDASLPESKGLTLLHYFSINPQNSKGQVGSTRKRRSICY
jgi:ankyrin repeat protein